MKVYKNFDELAQCPHIAVKTRMSLCYEEGEVPRTFEEDFGGDAYLIESFEDLKEVTVYDLDSDSPKSIFDSVGTFDIVEQIAEDMLLIVSITNNNGGPSYFIPRRYWNDNVLETLALANSER